MVDTEQPGFTTQVIEHKMGLHASDTASISLEDVEVTDDEMLGNVGDGFKVAMKTLDGGFFERPRPLPPTPWVCCGSSR